MLCICADKRADKNGKVIDNFQKLYQLSPTMFFGITGLAEEGFSIMTQLFDRQFSNPDEVIAFVDTVFTPRPRELTVTLAGRWKSGKFYLWNKNNRGEVSVHKPISNGLVYSISSGGDESIIPFFESTYRTTNNLR
jgi:hypothetical protein